MSVISEDKVKDMEDYARGRIRFQVLCQAAAGLVLVAMCFLIEDSTHKAILGGLLLYVMGMMAERTLDYHRTLRGFKRMVSEMNETLEAEEE